MQITRRTLAIYNTKDIVMLRYTINHPWSQRNCLTFVTRAAIETTGQIQIQLHWIAIVNIAVAVLCRSSLSIRRHFPFFVSTTVLIAVWEPVWGRYWIQPCIWVEWNKRSRPAAFIHILNDLRSRTSSFWTDSLRRRTGANFGNT